MAPDDLSITVLKCRSFSAFSSITVRNCYEVKRWMGWAIEPYEGGQPRFFKLPKGQLTHSFTSWSPQLIGYESILSRIYYRLPHRTLIIVQRLK